MRTLLLLAIALLLRYQAVACSCMGNNSYCETLSPGWFVNPDATALVVKLTDYHYGITVKVVQTFGGPSLPNDTLTVWGDNGALCRISLNGIAVGDTVVFGLNETDFSGNFIWNQQYPANLEMAGDYMVSVCGVYALNYSNGLVNGWITGPFVSSMDLTDFDALVSGCTIGTGVEEIGATSEISVSYSDGIPWIALPGRVRPVTLGIIDAQGRTVQSRKWDGREVPITGLSAGVYVLNAERGGRRSVLRVVVR